MTQAESLAMRPHEWETVRAILKAHVPEFEVWGFGSRATGKAWAYSDLDLAIVGDAPLDPSRRAALREAFVESDLPWKVDLVDWLTAGARFRRTVERRGRVMVQKRGLAGPTPADSASRRSTAFAYEAHEARE